MLLPGIVASKSVNGTLPVQGSPLIPAAAELLLNVEPSNTEDTGVINIDIGEDFVGRFFLVSWVATRTVVTGQASSPTLSVNGQSYPFFDLGQTAFGWNYYAFVFVSGTTMTVRSTIVNADIRRYTVWRIGTPTKPAQIVGAANQFVSSTSSLAITVPRPALITPDTRLIAVTGARPQDSGPTIVENWMNVVSTNQTSHREPTTRFEFSQGVLPDGSNSITLPASAVSRQKEGRVWQIRGTPPGEPAYRASDANLKYHFDAARGCFRDSEQIIACTDGDGVAVWKNQASSVDASQSEPPRRPVFRTGGVNGKPYIECSRDQKNFFNDLLDLPQPVGITGWTPLTITMVVHFYDYNQENPILGDPSSSYKGAFFVQTDGRIRYHKGPTATAPLVPVNQPVVISARVRSNTSADFLVNGVFTTITLAGNSPSAAQPITQFLRSTGSLGERHFHGRLYELFINHDTPAIQQSEYEPLHRFLMQKYGLTLPY